MSSCNCRTYYLFYGEANCLHKLFSSSMIKIIVREVSYKGIQFYIYSEKPKEKSMAWKRGWWRNGTRSQVRGAEQIKLAIELAEKYQVKKVRLDNANY